MDGPQGIPTNVMQEDGLTCPECYYPLNYPCHACMDVHCEMCDFTFEPIVTLIVELLED